MADIQHYERVIKPPKNGKPLLYKILLLAILAVALGAWLVVSVRFSVHIVIILLIPALLIFAAVLLWKYTNFEYEYSFTAGQLTYSKIYGRARRRMLFTGDLKTLRSIVPYDRLKAELSKDDKVIMALPDINCTNPCVCVFDEDEKKTYLVIDCDEMSARIFRFFNPSATDRSVFAQLESEKGEENA